MFLGCFLNILLFKLGKVTEAIEVLFTTISGFSMAGETLLGPSTSEGKGSNMAMM